MVLRIVIHSYIPTCQNEAHWFVGSHEEKHIPFSLYLLRISSVLILSDIFFAPIFAYRILAGTTIGKEDMTLPSVSKMNFAFVFRRAAQRKSALRRHVALV
jgi:hypothetical protein